MQFVNSYHPSYGDFEDNGGLEEALDKACLLYTSDAADDRYKV